MKILLAVDGSAYTKKMLAYLVTHTELFGDSNSYMVLNVQPALPGRAASLVGKDAVDGYHVEEAEKVLAPVCKFLERHGLTAKSSWKVGHVGETIAKTASVGRYDLLVMGSHGHGSLGNLVMGSVVNKVMAACEVPLLLVR